MKKYIALILSICLFLTFFAGCAKQEKVEDNTEDDKAAVTFVAPENYVSVVQITINPTVNLYLDANEVILAVEYVNEDAKECYGKVEKEIVGKKLDAGVDTVVKTAESDGYFAENKAVTIDIVESKVEEKKAAVLSIAQSSVKAVITEKAIDAEIKFTPSAQKVVDDKAAADKAAADKAAADKAAADKAAADKAAADKAAADKAAAEKEQKNPQKKLKKNVEYEIFKLGETDETMKGVHITFKDNGKYSYSEAPYLNDPYGEGEYRIYNGKKYYVSGGGGGAGEYTTTTEKIVMSGGIELELSMTLDGKLKVEKVIGTDDYFKVGDIIQIFSNSHTITVNK